MPAHPGNPYDGQTLAPTFDQVARLTGVLPARCYVERGYRRHKVEGETEVFVTGRRRGITGTIGRELRRREFPRRRRRGKRRLKTARPVAVP